MAGRGDESEDLRTTRMAATVRRASTGLKIAAALLAVSTVVASAISATTDLNQFYGGPEVQFPWRVKLSTFLSGAVPNLAWAALVYAAAIAIQVAWIRKDRVRPTPPEPPDLVAPPPLATPQQVALDDDHLWKPR